MLCSHAFITQTDKMLMVKEMSLYLAIGLLFSTLVVTVTVSGTVCHRMGKLNKRLKRYY